MEENGRKELYMLFIDKVGEMPAIVTIQLIPKIPGIDARIFLTLCFLVGAKGDVLLL